MTILKCLLLISFIAFTGRSFGQEFSIGEYRGVFDLIKSDSELSKKYCGSDSMRLTVHSSFEYCPISMFNGYLTEQDFTGGELKRLKKLDRKQNANQNLLTYKSMTDEFYSSLSLDSSPCAIVCFDRLKEFLIVAQVMTPGSGLDWKKMSSNKNIDVLIFDVRTKPYTYRKFLVIR
jgi:hypothetical protein